MYRQKLSSTTEFVQLGYGKTKKDSMDEGSLQLKTAGVKGFLNTEHGGLKNLILLDADDTWTTWEGDWGGPLFAIEKGKIALLGVTTGSNYYTNKTDDDDDSTIENNAVTASHI